MVITDKTRKILWARSGNKCVLCNQQLIESVGGNETIVGEECHIISEKPNGPRHKMIDKYNEYDNLILLCSVHHKLIDDNEKVFSQKILLELKKAHEQNVACHKKKSDGMLLTKMEHTRDLVRCLDDAMQYATDYPVE